MDKANLINEHFNLKCWFDQEYPRKEQKYRRLIALGKKTDDGEDPQVKLIELFEYAEQVRNRIQEIEELVGVENL